MSSFSIPLSGLVASQNQLQAVSNNLANLDTVGYKDQNVSFSDLFAQSTASSGAGNPIQQGLGVATSQTTSDFTSGTPSATGVPSNMALSGNGLFVTQTTNGTQAFTRAGDFTTNTSGQLVTPAGDLVMGYGAVNGVVQTAGALQPLQVGIGAVIPATATTSFQISANLNANSPTGTTFASSTPIYDSLGTSHELSVNYTKTGANTWSYSVNVPTADTGAASSQIASGTLSFDSSGNLTSPTGSIALNIPSFTDAAAPMNLTWNLADTSGNPTLTQTNLASASSSIANGQASGTLTSYAVGSDGTIEGTYSNGQTSALGQVAVASFINVQGLANIGNNDLQVTAGSGAAQIGIAGTGGRGTITGGSIEASNVDVAAEFAKMIVAQQAYSANAKTVTTMDQISQTTIQMITA
jgi:flagellar hook protein FlgE